MLILYYECQLQETVGLDRIEAIHDTPGTPFPKTVLILYYECHKWGFLLGTRFQSLPTPNESLHVEKHLGFIVEHTKRKQNIVTFVGCDDDQVI